MVAEYEQFSIARNHILSVNPSLRTAEKWGKCVCLPLDIPRFDYPDLTLWFFENCRKLELRPSMTTVDPEYISSSVDGIDLIADDTSNPILQQPHDWVKNKRDEFFTEFSHIHEHILDSFPIKKLYGMRLWSSTRNITLHREVPHFVDYPGSFRVMLFDRNPQQTLHVVPVLPDHDVTNLVKTPVPVLPETNSFAWNNLRSKHGSDHNPAHRKVLLIIENYTLDVDRYHDLMKRSLKKYEQHALFDRYDKHDYVDTSVYT